MKKERLSEDRITFRVTDAQRAQIRRAMKEDGFHMESEFMRRVLTLYLQKNGFMDNPPKKPRSPGRATDAPSTGSTRAYRQHGIALIAEDPSGTPSQFVSVRSRK